MTQVNAALVSPRPQSLQGDLSQLGPVADASSKDFRLAQSKVEQKQLRAISDHIQNLLNPARRSRPFGIDLSKIHTYEITGRIRDALRKAGELGKQAGEDPTIAVQAVLYGVGYGITNSSNYRQYELEYLNPIIKGLNEPLRKAFDAGVADAKPTTVGAQD